jgi:hypothetical protein
MKYLLFALLLIGCSSTPPKIYTVQENPIPVIIARGIDKNVTWTCEVEELNQKLVWIPCVFHNEQDKGSSSCVKVTFYDNVALKPVVESRKVCSGLLAPDENKTNYAAFIKEKRETLQHCGELLNLCVMRVEPVK